MKQESKSKLPKVIPLYLIKRSTYFERHGKGCWNTFNVLFQIISYRGYCEFDNQTLCRRLNITVPTFIKHKKILSDKNQLPLLNITYRSTDPKNKASRLPNRITFNFPAYPANGSREDEQRKAKELDDNIIKTFGFKTFVDIHGHNVEALIKNHLTGTLKESKDGWLNGYERVLKNIKCPTKEFLADYQSILSAILKEFKLYSVINSDVSGDISSIYSDSVTDNLHSSSKKPYSNLKNQNLLTDNGFPAARACIFGEPKGDWEKIIHWEVQRLAITFQETLIAEGFAEPDYFDEIWWHNNKKIGNGMITADLPLLGYDTPVEYWIRVLTHNIVSYHKRDPQGKVGRDNSWDCVPKIRNLRAVIKMSSKVDALRQPTKIDEIKEEIRIKVRKWEKEYESRPATTKLANEQKESLRTSDLDYE